MKPRTIQLISLLGLLRPLLAAAETLSGRVVKITDGDTVHVLDSAKARHKIRLPLTLPSPPMTGERGFSVAIDAVHASPHPTG